MSKRTRMEVHKEVAFWQRGTVILAILFVLFAACAAYAVDGLESKSRRLIEQISVLAEERDTAEQLRNDALARLGSLRQEFDAYIARVEYDRVMEEAERAQAMAAYEAVGIYRYIGVCTLTAYCCESKDNPHICGTGDGLTASGLPIAPGMVAVDPSIIPLGSTVIINGVSYLAADTGVTGYHIDIAVQTHDEATAFGVSSEEIWIIPPGGGEDGN